MSHSRKVCHKKDTGYRATVGLVTVQQQNVGKIISNFQDHKMAVIACYSTYIFKGLNCDGPIAKFLSHDMYSACVPNSILVLFKLNSIAYLPYYYRQCVDFTLPGCIECVYT